MILKIATEVMFVCQKRKPQTVRVTPTRVIMQENWYLAEILILTRLQWCLHLHLQTLFLCILFLRKVRTDISVFYLICWNDEIILETLNSVRPRDAETREVKIKNRERTEARSRWNISIVALYSISDKCENHLSRIKYVERRKAKVWGSTSCVLSRRAIGLYQWYRIHFTSKSLAVLTTR